MRLVLKLTLAIVAGMCLVLAVHGYLSVKREAALIESDMRSDHYALGRGFALALAEEWRINGETRARQLVQQLNDQEHQVLVRWVWLNAAPTDPDAPHVPADTLLAALRDSPVVSVDHDDSAERRLYTYLPMQVAGPRMGALEFSESLAPEAAYIRTTIVWTVVTAGAVAVLSGVIAVILGAWFVGRPIHRLIDKAQRIGAGDLAGPLAIEQRDEIGDLAAEINAMSVRLAEANQNLQAEVAVRIATLEQLRHADRLATVGRLASGIAHELGTPLNVVSGRAKMIVTGEVTGDEAVENARILLEQSQRMTAIIRQLLDFARRRSPQKVRADVEAIVRQVFSLLAPLAAKRQVALSCEGDAGVAQAEVDAAQLQQVLANLVVNGIQAMPHGGRLQVGLCGERARPPGGDGHAEGQYLRLDVRDEGHGIPAEMIDRIFEPFFTTKSVGEGTGLGLSVAYGIVREHGGWIDVRSEVGRGSCFSVYLPQSESHT